MKRMNSWRGGLCVLSVLVLWCLPVVAHGQIIVFQSDRGHQEGAYSVRPDGSNLFRLSGPSDWHSIPLFSPDGSRILYWQAYTAIGSGFWIMDPNGGNREYIVNPGLGVNHEWSPTGEYFLYNQYVGGGDRALVVKNANNAHPPLELINAGPRTQFATWSPDGTQIVFDSVGGSLGSGLFVVNADGTGSASLVTSPGGYSDWSVNNEIAFTYLGDIYIINPDGTGETLFRSNAVYPKWSSDGARIAFIDLPSRLAYVIDRDGSNLTQVSTGEASFNRWATPWSPDGTQLVYMGVRNGNFDICVGNVDGSGETNVTNHPGNDLFPSWGGAPVHNTPIGNDVVVTPTDPNTSTAPVEIIFDEVIAPGETTVTITTTGPPPSEGFQLAPGSPLYFDIETTADYVGPITICIDYSGLGISGGLESVLTLHHYEDPPGAWVDITTTLDTVNDIICGETTSLSPFAIFLPDNTPPVAVCASTEILAEATFNDGALVELDASFSYDDDGDALTFHWDVPDTVDLDDASSALTGGMFPIGVTIATVTVTDGFGGVDTCDVTITVQDTTPPEVVCTSDVAVLWPPNHDMHTVRLIVHATDLVTNPEDIHVLSLSVSSDELDDSDGQGTSIGDVDGQDGFAQAIEFEPLVTFDADLQAWIVDVELRAERDGDGDGRCYTVSVVALDTSQNPAEASCCIVVPHDRRGHNN